MIYGNGHVYKLINAFMLDGKKAVAEAIVYRAFAIVEETLKKDPLEVFLDVVENIRPFMEVRSRRIGGATYQIPVEVRTLRSYSLFIRWFKEETRKRKEKETALRLANEIMDAYNSQGGTFKRRENMQKMVDANRAFSHLKF